MKALISLALVFGTSIPAWAEAPIDWYIDLKREAKYARIAARGGASTQDLARYSDAATRLVARIDSWDGARPSAGARSICSIAAQNFQAALQRRTAELRHTAIRDGETQRDACLAAIQSR